MSFISETQKEEFRRQIPEIKRGFDLMKIVDPGFYREMKNELFPEPTDYCITGRQSGKTDIYTARASAYLRALSEYKPGVQSVIFNDPATIVIWEDGSKTVVKCQPGDVYDREKGLLLCIAKKYFGNKGNFNEVLKKYITTRENTRGKHIKIIFAGAGALGANRLTGYVTSKPKTNGLLDIDPGYNVECDNGEIWRIAPDAEIIELD